MTESSIPMDRHKLCCSVLQQEMVCLRHKEPMKVYCRTDQQCICLLCLVDEHKGHDTVSAVTQRAEIQKSLGTAQANSRKTIQDRVKKLHDVRQAVESLKRTAKEAVEENERIFTDFIQSFERRCLEVKELIQDQGKAALGHAEGLQKRLEQEISDLRRRDAEIEQISNTENDSHFLQCWKILSTTSDLRGVSYEIPPLSFEPVSRAISELRDELEMICQRRFGRISETVSKLDEAAATPSKKHKARAEASPYAQELKDWQTGRGLGPPMSKVQIVASSALPPPPPPQFEPEQEPRTRAEFLRYACGLTLDPNTAHKNLHLSPGDRQLRL
ncbi:hypothetical protein AGOR_G00156560 [Albula goreensis]|uniref:B box-type domain-containing protein n=1 Tax=Albula goreensis TaxID=1534307 RepID=A0A8T3D3U8_9TELE|nr:hypothetical protein AGOR_G00156560 [Albula goreensis]